MLFLDCGRAHREKDLFEMQIPDLPKGNQVPEVEKMAKFVQKPDDHVGVHKGVGPLKGRKERLSSSTRTTGISIR